MRRRVLRFVSIPLLVALAAGASILLIDGMPDIASAQTPAVEIHAAHEGSFVPTLESRGPLFILVLGSDARLGERVDRARADSIHLVGVNMRKKRATILGFPRDSWVPIPGNGTTKINTAMYLGGPDLMVQTIESLTGIRIDYYVLASFGALTRMVDGIGGLKVDVPYAMHDSHSGTNFSPGEQRLNGKKALAFARDRHSTPGGDFGRSANQGRLILAALKKLQANFEDDAGRLFTWIRVGWRNLRTDLSFPTLLDLALTATEVESKGVNNLVVPATVGTVGAQSVVYISSSAASMYADMRADGIIDK